MRRRSWLRPGPRWWCSRTGRAGARAMSGGRGDPAPWLLTSEWDDVGSYRRALSTYEVKITAVPLLSRAIDEPTAFEVLTDADGNASASPPTPGGSASARPRRQSFRPTSTDGARSQHGRVRPAVDGQHAGESGLPSAPAVRLTVIAVLLPLIAATVAGLIVLAQRGPSGRWRGHSAPTRRSSTSTMCRAAGGGQRRSAAKPTRIDSGADEGVRVVGPGAVRRRRP